MSDENLMYEEPPEGGCITELDGCLVGSRVMIRASRISRTKVRAHGRHRKAWTKADNAKCWIERTVHLTRSRA